MNSTKGVLALVILLVIRCSAAQFVEITAEVTGDSWHYHLIADRQDPGNPPETNTMFRPPWTVRCVVGTNMWMVEDTNKDFVMQRWFTGTKLVINEFWIGPDGQRRTGRDWPVNCHELDPSDGNTCRPAGDSDLFVFDINATLCWMAFCSAPTLKHEGRIIYPTSALWKQYVRNWKEKTSVFPDGLGLPRSIELVTTNKHPLFEYQAHMTTNFMGWTFPTEFFAVQNWPSTNNEWQVFGTMKGRITSIRATTEPKIPDDVAAEAHKAGRSWR
jgi:hypothetical protein